jgi:hypothetical protein
MPDALRATLAALDDHEAALARLRGQGDPDRDRQFVAAVDRLTASVCVLRAVVLQRDAAQEQSCE